MLSGTNRKVEPQNISRFIIDIDCCVVFHPNLKSVNLYPLCSIIMYILMYTL